MALKAAAKPVCQDEPRIVRQNGAGKRWIYGKVQLVAVGAILSPFVIGAEIRNARFDLDYEDGAAGGHANDIGTTAIWKRHLTDGGHVMGHKEPHDAARNAWGQPRGLIGRRVVHKRFIGLNVGHAIAMSG